MIRIEEETDYTKGVYKNITCQWADKVNKYQGKCHIDCPFATCITSAKSRTINMILNTKTINHVITMIDKGISIEQIIKRHKSVPKYNIRTWVKHAPEYKEKLRQLGIVKYLEVS